VNENGVQDATGTLCAGAANSLFDGFLSQTCNTVPCRPTVPNFVSPSIGATYTVGDIIEFKIGGLSPHQTIGLYYSPPLSRFRASSDPNLLITYLRDSSTFSWTIPDIDSGNGYTFLAYILDNGSMNPSLGYGSVQVNILSKETILQLYFVSTQDTESFNMTYWTEKTSGYLNFEDVLTNDYVEVTVTSTGLFKAIQIDGDHEVTGVSVLRLLLYNFLELTLPLPFRIVLP